MSSAAEALSYGQPSERHLHVVEQTPRETKKARAYFHPHNTDYTLPERLTSIVHAPMSDVELENSLNAIRDRDPRVNAPQVGAKTPTDETLVLKYWGETSRELARVVMLAVWSPDDEEILHVGAMRSSLDRETNEVSREVITLMKGMDMDGQIPAWLKGTIEIARKGKG